MGAIVSALLADNFPPSYSFIGSGVVGLIMAILVANTNAEIENYG